MTTITYINDARGYDVEVHKAGCRDIARKCRDQFTFTDAGNADVETTREAWLEYNVEFLDEGGAESAWPLRFLPCCGLKVDDDRTYTRSEP